MIKRFFRHPITGIVVCFIYGIPLTLFGFCAFWYGFFGLFAVTTDDQLGWYGLLSFIFGVCLLNAGRDEIRKMRA